MNDRDALFAAILAHPDEDTPRLAFADWLEENGDPKYAAFIRKQIELAKVPEWDPLWVRAWHRDRDSTTGRGYEQFVPKLPDGLKLLPLVSFRRGFVWHVESTGVEPFLTRADELFAAMPLQALTLRTAFGGYREPIDLTALFASPHLARIKQLTFTLARFTKDTVRQMQGCAHLSNLTELEFAYSSFDQGALATVFEAPLSKRLESLSFNNSSIAWSDVEIGLAKAGGPHRLRRFVACDYSGGGYMPPTVFAAPLLHGLKELDLHGHELGAAGFRMLCGSGVVARLESLTLSKSNPGVPGIKVLSECSALKGLKRLLLWTNSIGPVGMKHLADSPHLTGLQILGLTQNPVGDRGARAIAGAAWAPNLIELDLSSTEISDTGAEALLNALSPDRLINLSLSPSSHRVKLSDNMRKRAHTMFSADGGD